MHELISYSHNPKWEGAAVAEISGEILSKCQTGLKGQNVEARSLMQGIDNSYLGRTTAYTDRNTAAINRHGDDGL
jgi:hypothetical protein